MAPVTAGLKAGTVRIASPLAHEEAPRIRGEGTRESEWHQCTTLWQRPSTPLPQLLREASRLVVVAPHPDDEVLACGGLMALAAAAGVAVEVIAVTDGEACYPGERWWTPERLVAARRQELAQALDALGVTSATGASVQHLGIGDGTVQRHEQDLERLLRPLLRVGDLVLAPWRHDGHPDHEAAARAALAAASTCGARALEYPVWAWHWLRPEQTASMWQRPLLLDITTVTADKQRAIACFATQTGAVDQLHADPILPPHVLARFARNREVFLG